MRLLNRLGRTRHAHVVQVVVVSFVSLVAIASWTAAAEPGSSGGAEPPRALFYTGIETEPVRGTTEVTGARASVRLEPVLQGDQVRHDFWIDNPRDVELELRDVTACSGCILLDYSRKVAPRGRGRIAILIVTDSRGGETIEGTIRAETDDPTRPLIEIDVSMKVREFAALSPYRVWLEGHAGEKIVAKTTVVPNERYPFDITGIKTRRGAYFDLSWAKTTVDGRPGWEITLTNTRTRPGPYQDVLYIQTDHPDRPELEVRVEGRIAEPGAPPVKQPQEEESPDS
ncbi:MAG TPA: hypothetical protein ENO23_10950 [Alphaproteobacteria bacterium]|nr:hypothetical protein [Alphaproteobacteria bacterium]